MGLLLCIPFACSIGGVGTLTGTDLNLYLAGFHADMYKTYKEVTVATVVLPTKCLCFIIFHNKNQDGVKSKEYKLNLY